MTRVFLSFLALLSLFSFATAERSRGMAASPVPGLIRSRQVTRDKLTAMRERRDMIARGALRPRASAKLYPKCPTGTVAGFARFTGYDYFGHDVPNGSPITFNEAECLETCKANSQCVGIFWYQGASTPCYHKTTTNDDSALYMNEPSSTPGSGANLQGSCSSYEGIIDPAKLADCCDTVDAFPTCSAPSLAGYARFPQWDYVGADLGAPLGVADETACLTACTNDPACVGVFYWPNRPDFGNTCFRKLTNYVDDNFSQTTPAAMAPGSASDLLGTCNNQLVNGVSTPMQDCCNTYTA